jgi:predicted AAA+ superfamily ATPase
MDRLINEELLRWKISNRRKPLILKGVRQCGKTYTLRRFGKENYSDTAYFNFEGNPDLVSIFEKDMDPHRIIDDLCLKYHINITKDTLIIFDEVQFCNAALTSMKYFCEEAPEYHIICAGSLLGIMLSKPLSFPVGKVNFLTMYPMSFPEFLMAMGEFKLYERLKIMQKDEPVAEAFMTTLMRLYREYCFVGGMPEAVDTWISTRDPEIVRKVQSEIVMSYESDFAKHAPSSIVQKLIRIWASIPEQLSKENRKFLFGHAVKGARARDLEDALQWLIDAGLVIKVSMISKPSIPLSAYADSSDFKLYYSDIGLLGAMARVPSSSLISDDERYREFKGGMNENYVLTELTASTEGVPFYWRSRNKAEVDFVHMIGDFIVPIEVKSGFPKRIQSMERYIQEYEPEKAAVISERNVSIGKLTFVPLPLVWNLKHYL